MKGFIKKHWKLTLLLGAGIVFFVFLFLDSERQEPTTPPVTGRITPTTSPQPTTITFGVVNTFPPSGPTQMAIPNLALQFTFSKSLDLSSASVVLTPFENFDFKLSEDEKTLIIENEYLFT